MLKRIGRPWRGNLYGLLFETMWPHVSIGVSLHVGRPWRLSHLTLHTPIGYLIIGMIGAAA